MFDELLPPALFTEAADMDASPARLTELVRHTVLQPLVAANPATPPSLLEELSTSSDPAVRRSVAQNPNASIQTLGYLAAEFPQEFLRNPIIPFLNMTRPGFVKELPAIAWPSLLRFENISPSWLQQIKNDRIFQRNQPAVWRLMQLHVSQIGKTPNRWKAEAGEELKRYREKKPQPPSSHAADEVDMFLLFVLLFPQCLPILKKQWIDAARILPRRTGIALSLSKVVGGKTLALLSSERNPFILCQVAGHPRTPTPILANLAGRRQPAVQRAVASNPHTPLEDIYKLMSNSDSSVCRATVSHPVLTQEDYAILAIDDDSSVRAALAGQPRPGLDILTKLANDSAVEVRAAVARNVRVAPEILAKLAGDPEPEVRAAAAGNPRLSGEIQYALLADPEVAVRASLSGNACLPELCYTQLAQDPSPMVRKYLAANARTPAMLLEVLWQTGEMEVWQGIARYPKADPQLLARLAQQGDVHVRAAVAAHKHTPVEVLRILAQEDIREIWYGLATNPHTPLDILQSALATPYTDLWYRLVNHPTMMRNQRRLFLTLLAGKLQPLIATNNRPDWLRKVLFQYYTALPATIVELFASSPHWEERYLAARHPQMAESVLDALNHDGICYIRAAAQDALERRKRSRDLLH